MSDPAAWSDADRAVSGPADRAAAVRADRAAQLRAGGLVIATLAVLGAVLGLVWEWWSPPGPAGIVLTHGIQADETEAFVAGDGRFALITVIVGIVAGVAAWRQLRRVRGPYFVTALAVGGVVGAGLTELVGWAIRGDGTSYRCGNGTYTCVDHLPLTVHMHGLLLIEAAAATLVYLLFVAFAAADDLGRPDPGAPDPGADAAREPEPVASAAWPSAPSVGPQGDLQDPGRHGDAPGPA